jgi:hypothetical protein
MNDMDALDIVFVAVNLATAGLVAAIIGQAVRLARVAKRRGNSRAAFAFLLGVAAWALSVLFNAIFWAAVLSLYHAAPDFLGGTRIRVWLIFLNAAGQLGPVVGLYIAWRYMLTTTLRHRERARPRQD